MCTTHTHHIVTTHTHNTPHNIHNVHCVLMCCVSSGIGVCVCSRVDLKSQCVVSHVCVGGRGSYEVSSDSVASKKSLNFWLRPQYIAISNSQAAEQQAGICPMPPPRLFESSFSIQKCVCTKSVCRQQRVQRRTNVCVNLMSVSVSSRTLCA